jgi:HEPN domain-containing protein
MGDASVFEDAVFGFHAQQAVEKALKAWLCLVNEHVQRTHDLASLSAQLKGAGVSEVVDYDDLLDLTDFAVAFRYSAMELDLDLDRAALAARVGAVVSRVGALFDLMAAQSG